MYHNKFYLGTITPDGYYSPFAAEINQPNRFTYILKGDRSCSDFIAKISEANNSLQDIYYCSAQPGSIDAITLLDKNTIVCDSISPHVFEPEIQGAAQQIVNLGDCWDLSKLRENYDELSKLYKNYKNAAARAMRALIAVGNITDDAYRIGSDAFLKEKTDGFIGRFVKKFIPKIKDKEGSIKSRQFSAVTPDGYSKIYPANSENGEIFYIKDECIYASSYILKELTKTAAEYGYTVIKSICPIIINAQSADICDGVSIPELSLHLFFQHPAGEQNVKHKTINAARFYVKSVLSKNRGHLRFDEMAYQHLMNECKYALSEAAEILSQTEIYYTEAANTEKIDKLCKTLI
ncbi:MAG: hypothetical protein LBM87_09020 [Ruminococcus sp.]|jgi:hypothetical protein|nr:hypothetical protein [Ruminococcus sp.]